MKQLLADAVRRHPSRRRAFAIGAAGGRAVQSRQPAGEVAGPKWERRL
jgi:hypothetical protein